MNAPPFAFDLAERGWLPDPLIRIGIRSIVRERLDEISAGDAAQALAVKRALYRRFRRGPIAVLPDLANEQHYEVPPGVLRGGPRSDHLKYSGCHWPAKASPT